MSTVTAARQGDLAIFGGHPVARELGETSLMFLVHPTLSEQDMADTSSAVAKVMAVAVRR